MIQKYLRLRQIVAVHALFAGGLFMTSCGEEKNVTPSPSFSIANYAGTFVGISSCDTGVILFKINAGTDRTKISIPATFGEGDCQLVSTVNGTVTNNVLKIDTTHYQDYCFADYTVSGSATMVKDSLFLTINATSPLGNASCSFMGKKIADTTGTK